MTMNAAMWMAWLAMAGGVGVYGWGWEKTGARGRRWLEWGLFALVAGVSAVSVALHEPWADEVHAWLQAREMGLGALWKEMSYEGHFLPWYLLLWPLAHAGAPSWTMGCVSWWLNAVAVWWLARRSPLTGWEKAAAGMSCVFLYVNPVISRCYVLAPLALFGVASLWKRRDERPVSFGLWTALLANTHLCMEGVAVALFGVYAWENVLKRADGKGWRECGQQWAGLAVMAAGGMLAATQVLPGLWESSVGLGRHFGWRQDAMWFFRWCKPLPVVWGVAAGLVWLGVESWRRDKGVFGVYAVGLAYMAGFSVFLYPAHVVNRALSWWPVAVGTAWALGGIGDGGGKRETGRIAAVVAMGVGLLRPDMTLDDWRRPYDPLPAACRWIAATYGRDAEVWINGEDCLMEGAKVWLSNAMDWQTGKRAERICWASGSGIREKPFERCREELFWQEPDRKSFLAMGPMADWRGLTPKDAGAAGVTVEWMGRDMVCPECFGILVVRVRRGSAAERRDFWLRTGMERMERGDREGAMDAWERAVWVDAGCWVAMNNLAWMLLEEGRTEDARRWIDRAMEHESARANAGARDTEVAVRRAEGNEEGAVEAEERKEVQRERSGP